SLLTRILIKRRRFGFWWRAAFLPVGFIDGTEGVPVLTCTSIMMTAKLDSAAGKLDEHRGAIGMGIIKGADRKDPLVPPTIPRERPLDRNGMFHQPPLQVERAPGGLPGVALRFFWRQRCQGFQRFPGCRGEMFCGFEDAGDAVRPFRKILALAGPRAIELGQLCCIKDGWIDLHFFV